MIDVPLDDAAVNNACFFALEPNGTTEVMNTQGFRAQDLSSDRAGIQLWQSKDNPKNLTLNNDKCLLSISDTQFTWVCWVYDGKQVQCFSRPSGATTISQGKDGRNRSDHPGTTWGTSDQIIAFNIGAANVTTIGRSVSKPNSCPALLVSDFRFFPCTTPDSSLLNPAGTP